MVKEAVILVNLPFSGSGAENNKPFTKLLGLPFIERAIFTAQSTGIDRVLLVSPAGEIDLIQKMAAAQEISSLGIEINPLPIHQLIEGLNKGDGDHVLLFSDHMVFPAQLVQEMLEQQLGEDENLLVVTRPDERSKGVFDGVPIRLREDGRQVWKVNSNPAIADVFGCGPAVISNKGMAGLVHSLKQSYSYTGLVDFFSQWLANETCYVQEIYPYFCTLVRNKKSYKTARYLLLNSTRKETDGFVSRYFNRYASLLISRGALALGIRANQITLANLGVGFLAAFFLAMGGYFNTVMGGLLFQFTSILDGSDGEVAKLSFRATSSGAWLDTFCDQTITLVIFIGLTVGLYRNVGGYVYIALGVVSIISVTVLHFLLALYVKKTRGTGSMVKVVKDIEDEGHSPRKMGQTTLQRMISVLFSRIGFMVRRDFYAMVFMVLCLFSWQAIFLWGLAIIAPAASIYVLIFYLRKT